MANTNISRAKKFTQKREPSLFVAYLEEGTASDQIAVAGGNYRLGQLPPDAIITDAYVHTATVSDAVTTCVATLGTAEAGTQIMSAGNLRSAGKQGTFTGQSLTGTGKEIFLGVTKTGGNGTAVAKYYIVIEYLEYNKTNGEYTSYATLT